VGVRGAASDWWSALIGAHPRVARAPGRTAETRFFESRWGHDPDEATLRLYRDWFPRPEGALTGEWSSSYIHDVWVPGVLRRAAPDARLLVLLPDPITRFEADDLEGPARASANLRFGAGLYADLLGRLWRWFPRAQTLVLQQERCERDPEAELARTFNFLRLDAAPVRTIASRPTGAAEGRGGVSGLRDDQRRVLAARYAPENRRLASMLSEIDLSLWSLSA
jgi:hypothetical protein